MDYESLNNAILELQKDLSDFINHLSEAINNLSEAINNLSEAINNLAERIIESLEEYTERQQKPKYKPVLSLVKPYKQPYLKVRARARTNI